MVLHGARRQWVAHHRRVREDSSGDGRNTRNCDLPCKSAVTEDLRSGIEVAERICGHDHDAFLGIATGSLRLSARRGWERIGEEKLGQFTLTVWDDVRL